MKKRMYAIAVLPLLFAGCNKTDPSIANLTTTEAYYEGMDNWVGQDTEQDTVRAIALLERAAEPEKFNRPTVLGSLLGSLIGNPPPPEPGNPDAQRMLGQLYAFGQEVDMDRTRGIELYRRAAMQGDGASQAALGIAYERGLGVTQNLPTAYAWFQMAVKQNLNADGREGLRRIEPQMSEEEKVLGEKLFEALCTEMGIEPPEARLSPDVNPYGI